MSLKIKLHSKAQAKTFALNRPVQTILNYKKRLLKRLQTESTEKGKKPSLPRYVRVNTLKTTAKRAAEAFKSLDGFHEVTYDRDAVSYPEFLGLVRDLSEGEFLADYHVNDLLIFAPGTVFFEHPMYREGAILLQDKASCLPVQALTEALASSSDRKRTVLDACAAPGMKTTQAAAAPFAKMVIAVERDAARCDTLRKMVRESGADAVTEVRQRDFLRLDPADSPEVDCIVLDPSCSGSGMVGREGGCEAGPERLARLAALQTRMLRHAAAFPSVGTIVYSTCSVSEEENEKVCAYIACSSVLRLTEHLNLRIGASKCDGGQRRRRQV